MLSLGLDWLRPERGRVPVGERGALVRLARRYSDRARREPRGGSHPIRAQREIGLQMRSLHNMR